MAVVEQAEDQTPDQPSDRRLAPGQGRHAVYPWRLRNTPARRARMMVQVLAQTKTIRRKRPRCRELNLDALRHVLLLLPAKDLCRLRAVCQTWRSTTSDPIFITSHESRHPGLLLLAKFKDDKTHIHVVDLSGRIVKTMKDTSVNHFLMFTRLSLACLSTDWNRCRVTNPATGAVHILPQDPAPEHVKRVNLSNPYTFFALGRVASSGEYKVLRMFNRTGFLDLGEQLFEVYTINGGTTPARWRGRQSPECFIETRTGVVIDGVVYFLALGVIGVPPDQIMSFDLGS
ncbi:hypothetical protein QOZ80_7AG0562450 [Eleusine coracana subsp. coracana]|nr:hypothetical protein QOZ80_7AG0562450 [Eleusine coracana subsp. coracana]